ncbi:cytoplasmic dynein 2 intermediate chain 1 [Dendroctonus ponderosae]|uniref:cytoplasmic dynein 2 intermediate chain 1 n=1 Tax=Dendroctonus ponderosae TaxID=77166 RepID=UPI0020363878|nr:cytoplasmic dynein 2 intermediate chain 1 [Dendroctonus ponderosae]
MSTVKNVSKRSSTSKEPVASRVTAKKSTKETTNKPKSEAQKKPSSKPAEEKDLSKKSNQSAKAVASVPPKKTIEKIIEKRNVSGAPKQSTTGKAKPSTKTKQQSTSSSRVTRSEYYPSKNLFSNALKSVEKPPKPLDEDEDSSTKKSTKAKTESFNRLGRSHAINSPSRAASKSEIKSPTLKPKENKRELRQAIEKVQASDSVSETSSLLDRPRTATLRKGSIVNENIVGPEAPKTKKNIPLIKEALTNNREIASNSVTPEENYEEDFESYESDFDVASSSEDTTNLDIISRQSGSISSSGEDISEKRETSPIFLQKDPKRLSSAGTDDERKLDSGTFELSDFKHRQILRYIEDTVKKEDAILEHDSSKELNNPASLSDEGFEDQKSLQFINFADAKKKCEQRRASAARRKRGQELISMIKLDAMNFTIFDSPAVSYDVYIKNYGNRSSVQASLQTGEDDISEEVQTEVIDEVSKWTQMPNKFSTFEENTEGFWTNYKCEYLGVGAQNQSEATPVINQVRLTNFMKNSSELMLQILAEKKLSSMENVRKNKNNIPYSRGYLQFNTSQEMFRNTTVSKVLVVPGKISPIMSVHRRTKVELDLIGSIVCIWDTADLEAPRRVFVAFGEVCCATFSGDCENYVLAGQHDGAILVWNVEEKRRLYDISNQTPSFVTPIGSSHFAKVISVQTVSEHPGFKSGESVEDEICSLDESGKIIIWTLYSESESAQSINGVLLINTHTINLPVLYPELSDFVCSDCILMDDHIYVSTNYGFILHCLVKSNHSNVKKVFSSESHIGSTCMENCPFSPLYFVAGYSNGDISLFTRSTQRPLLVLQNKEQMESSSTQIIRWSTTKPFLFYVKDLENTVHVWDLQKSDLYPEYSVKFPENITCFTLSNVPNSGKSDEMAFMLIGTEDGKLYLHLLSGDYGTQSLESYHEDVKIFLNYVNRL